MNYRQPGRGTGLLFLWGRFGATLTPLGSHRARLPLLMLCCWMGKLRESALLHQQRLC